MTYKYYYILLAMMLGIMTAACSSDGDAVVEEVMPVDEENQRQMTDLTVSVSLDDSYAATRVEASPNEVNNGLKLSWNEREQLGVYIKKADNSVVRVGRISSVGKAGAGTRSFTGKVSEKLSGESYIYMHPDLGDSQTAISFMNQQGKLGDTDHLTSYIPIIWNEGTQPLKAVVPAYIVHVKMQFKENPGTIRSIKMCTMKRGNEDRIFPKTFDVRRMAATVNNTVASGTQGINLSADNNYTDNIVISVEGTATEVGTGSAQHWEADAYLACASVANLNVFNTKYHVTADCDGGLFTCSEFLSFPGQDKEPASTSRTLAMLADGKVYNLNAKLSKDVCNTVISSDYGISSILGMWDNNGVSYDPCGLKCTDDQLPNHLKDNKSKILGRNNRDENLSDLYKTHNVGFVPPNTPGEWRQTDVTTNNIDIVEDTEIVLSYLSEYGDYGNKNLLGYYFYPTPGEGENPPSAHSEVIKYILLPNVTAVDAFSSYNLLYVDENGYVSKKFPKGVTVGFYLMINPTATDAGHSADFNLMRWTQWTVFTNSIWNRANSNWRINTYARDNFFTSGDMSTSTSFANQIKGLAFYAAKDRAEENINNSWKMRAMHFVVATSNPDAMKTYNKGFINIGTGTLINNK